MKKAIVLIVLFTILATTFTSTMITIKKIDTLERRAANNEELSKSSDKEGQVANLPIEKTIDLYSTYDENDLIIKRVSASDYFTNVSGTFPQISGLKNVDVEDSINYDIKQRVDKLVNKTLNIEGASKITLDAYDYNWANFANVVSMSIFARYNKDEDLYYDFIGLNYELIAGNRLNIEDLFTDDNSIKDIYRMGLYRKKAQDKEDSWDYGAKGYSDDPVFYNEELGIWQFVRHYWTYYDSNTDSWIDVEKEEVLDYVSPLSDYDIEKLINKKYSQDDFWFSPSKIYFKCGLTYDDVYVSPGGGICSDPVNQNAFVYFKDISDKVTIYDKFLTNDSLYTNNNIGRKGVITCSAECQAPIERYSEFKSDNYFYDYTPLLNEYHLGGAYDNEIWSQYDSNIFSEELINNVNDKIQEIIVKYEKEAQSNKDEAYFLFIYPFEGGGLIASDGVPKVDLNVKLIKCDIEYKNKLMKEIFDDVYRYYSISYYANLYSQLYLGEEKTGFAGNKFEISCPSATMETTIFNYDIKTGEFIGNGFIDL